MGSEMCIRDSSYRRCHVLVDASSQAQRCRRLLVDVQHANDSIQLGVSISSALSIHFKHRHWEKKDIGGSVFNKRFFFTVQSVSMHQLGSSPGLPNMALPATSPSENTMPDDILDDISHRRYNPLRGSWVLVSPHRTKRPWQGQQEEASKIELPQYDPAVRIKIEYVGEGMHG